jgi:peptidyl-Lys metalloendopeptidase
MISLTICVTFASILTLSAVAASAEPSLSLCVSGPQTVEGVENLILTTTIANICNETLKLLNDPRGPLSKAPTDTFDIKGSADTKPLFIGIEVEYDPFKVVINGSQDAFTTLAPGESAVVEHDCMYAQD